MLKQAMLIAAIFIFSFKLLATDQTSSWHGPEMKNEVLERLKKQVSDQDDNLLKGTLVGAGGGLMLPWAASFALGGWTSTKFTQGKSDIAQFAGGTMAGMGSTILLSPVSLITMLPLGAIGGVVGFGRAIVHGVRTQKNEANFQQEVAQHFHFWVKAVMDARREIKEKIIAWQQSHNDDSIKRAVEELLNEKALASYVTRSNMSTYRIEGMLVNIKPEQDNWNHFFSAFSEQAKIPGITEGQWQLLAKALINWPKKDGFPILSREDIEQHLYVATYLFSIVNNSYEEYLDDFHSQRARITKFRH